MKKDKAYYLARAIQGFKVLVIYHCVTKPLYEKAYHKNCKFSKKELMRQMDFLSTWDDRTKKEKQILAYKYAEYSKTFNYTFGIPRKLVADVLGAYQDEQGKLVRIHIDEVVDWLVKKGWLKVLNHGSKTKKNDDGKLVKSCWWTKKYLIANKNYWLTLLDDDRYSDYSKYPLDDLGFTIRAVKAIAKFRKANIPQVKKSTPKKSKPKAKPENKKTMPTNMTEQYVRGLMNETQVENELRAMGWTQKDIDKAIDGLNLRKKIHGWQKQLMRGNITLDDYLSTMKKIGMTDEQMIKVKQAWEEKLTTMRNAI